MRQGSNPRHSACKADALPAELRTCNWSTGPDSNRHGTDLQSVASPFGHLCKLAEGQGFEPWDAARTPPIFKTGAFNHSANLPMCKRTPLSPRRFTETVECVLPKQDTQKILDLQRANITKGRACLGKGSGLLLLGNPCQDSRKNPGLIDNCTFDIGFW